MFEIFNTPLQHQIGTINVTGWNQARNVLTAEFNRLLRYHRQNVSFVNNDHLLVRLLNSTEYDSGLLSEVALRLNGSYDNKMTSLGIGSPFGRPDFTLNSWFYNKKTYEILVQDSSLFDADYIYENWQDAQPIRVLHHPFNDLSLAYPNGKYVSNEKPGYAVISINPSMLAIMYKGYLDSDKVANNGVVSAPGIWISQYPLFNMMNSHIDIVLRNRLIAMFQGTPLAPYRSAYSMAINNPTSYVDTALATVVKNLRSQPFKFDKVLETIPAFSRDTQRGTTAYPLNIASHHTSWIYDLARAPLLDFLIRYNNVNPNYQNLDIINKIKRSITEMEMDKSIPPQTGAAPREYFNNLKGLVAVL